MECTFCGKYEEAGIITLFSQQKLMLMLNTFLFHCAYFCLHLLAALSNEYAKKLFDEYSNREFQLLIYLSLCCANLKLLSLYLNLRSFLCLSKPLTR